MKLWRFALALSSVLLVLAWPATEIADAAEPSSTSPNTLRVMLLGDSYIAGNGGRKYYGPAKCYRSPNNWASLWAAKLRANGQPVSIDNHACSGAVTLDFARSQHGNAPQYQWVDDMRAARYDIVFISIGGNDILFGDIVVNCMLPGARSVKSCEEQLKESQEKAADALHNVKAVLRHVVNNMRPGARIVYMSYPLLEQYDDYSLTERITTTTGTGNEEVTLTVGATVRSFGRKFRNDQARVVQEVNNISGRGEPIVFMNSLPELFNGREPDASNRTNPSRALRELPPGDIAVENRAEFYHYNSGGHELVADYLFEKSRAGVMGEDGAIFGVIPVPDSTLLAAIDGGAVAGAAGQDVIISGYTSRAFTPIMSYDWDLDGDGLYETPTAPAAEVM